MQAINGRLAIALKYFPVPGQLQRTVAAYVIYETRPGGLRIVGAIPAADADTLPLAA